MEDNLSVQDISYEKLSSQLLKDGQVLELIKDNRVAFGVGIDPDDFNGVVVDGNQIIFEGEWVESTSLRPFIGFSYHHDGNGGKGMRTASFPFEAPINGLHEIKVSYVSSVNRAGNVRYEIEDEKRTAEYFVDQRKLSENNIIWHSLGSFVFKKGKILSSCF